MLNFVDTNVVVALLLETDPHHKDSVGFFKEIKIDIPESTYREIRRTFMTKYNTALRVLLKAISKAKKENPSTEDEMIALVEKFTLEIGAKVDPYLMNFYEYLLKKAKEQNLLHSKNIINITRYFDDHLVELLSKIQGFGKPNIIKLSEEDLELSKEIYQLVGDKFKDFNDAEIFCQVVSILIKRKEEGKLYTFDQNFAKAGSEAIKILNRKGYDVNLDVIYFPSILSQKYQS
jgi:predicted nucleic acid-binding protein